SLATASYAEGGGFLSSASTELRNSDAFTQAVGSQLGGRSVTVASGKDLSVQGSSVISDQQTTLLAGNNITIEAAQNSSSKSSFKETKSSGLSLGDGMSVSYGKQQQSLEQQNQSTTAAASTVASIGGNVTLVAGNQYSQKGSDVVTPGGDVNVLAKNIKITEAQNTSSSQTEQKFKQSGLTLALSSPVISAAQTIQGVAKAAGQTSDGRAQALAVATGALAAKNAYDAIAKNPAQAGGVNLSISLGSSKSQSNTASSSSTAQGSTVAAGGNVNITATDGGKDSNILIQGSTVKADGNVTLAADNQVNLLAAKNTSSQNSTNSSSSGSIGVSVGTSGLSVTASASKGRGNSDGSDVTYTNARVEAGNTLSIQSGGDTNIKGAVAAGKTVIADVGGNLNIESLQDNSTYNAKERSAGGSIGIPIGAGAFSIGANVGKTDINSTFSSVTQQSGIKAGDGGFDIVVKGKTDLKGAVIASTDKAASNNKNSLITGSLTSIAIENKAEYSGQSVNIGISYSGEQKDKNGNTVMKDGKPVQDGYNGFNATPPVALNAKGNASSTTQSGISQASILITDEDAQKASTGKDAATTVASINRDVTTDKDTSNALKPIFNEQEIKAGFAITQALMQEVGTFLVNRAKEADIKASEAKDKDRQADDKAAQAQGLSDGPDRTRLLQEATELKAQAIVARVEAADIESKWGAAGTYRQVMTAIAAAAAGNVSAGGSQFVQSAVVNLVQSKAAEGIKQLADDLGIAEGSVAHTALHAINACLGAAAQASSCGTAALGAASATVVSSLLEGTAETLSNEQKEARKNLVATLVTGVAAASGQAAAANTAALIEMENNSNVKNAVKAAINDAKDYIGKKGKEGLEKAAELLEKIEIKPLVDKQKDIAKFLDDAAARGGLSEGEIAVLGAIYAANQVLFPTSMLDIIPGAGKAVGKTGDLIKAGVKAEDAAKVAVAEVKASGQIHHICTDKNCVSAATGGPWTPEFKKIFDKAGVSMQDELNKVLVVGHQGPHPASYHQTVFQRLSEKTENLSGDAFKQAFQNELKKIGEEIAQPGSVLNKLVTKK
ncbi:hemagglutinin repeat-containing protein, partial [Polaromonas sp.]|uniref:hemagglutinin repeat-containing protein n=1 Tax=Polaromonas sp. TaxID=1869339 RepID=UPI002FC63D83